MGFLGGRSLIKSNLGQAIGGGSGLESYIAALNPVLDFRFDETSGTTAINYGSAGAAANGTYTNSPTLNQAGQLGAAVLFDASADLFTVAHNSAWADLEAWEWMFIQKLSIGNSGNQSRLMGPDGSGYNARATINRSSTGMIMNMFNTGGTSHQTQSKFLQPTSVWMATNWNFDNGGDRKARGFVNSVEFPAYTSQVALTGTYRKPTIAHGILSKGFADTAMIGGMLNRVLLFGRKLTGTERQTIVDGYNLPIPVQANQIVCTGDSLTFGTGGTNTYPNMLAGLLITNSVVKAYGVSGETLSAIIAKEATRADLDYSASYSNNVLVAWVGLVDLWAGAGAAGVQAAYQGYCEARRAVGWKVIACTVTPSSSAGISGGYDARRTTFNTWLRANWSTFADGLADPAADSRIGDAGDENDTTYYFDKLHMTSAGYEIQAQLVANAITPLL